MKTRINLFGLVVICLTALLLTGMDGCNTEDDAPPVTFLQATPASDSTIQTDATITATFDGTPAGLDVNAPEGVTFSPAENTVTITGGFTPGPLTLVLTWASGTTTLTYTVEPDPVNEEYNGESIYFKIGDTFQSGEVIEGVSETEVRVRLDDGSEKVIHVDRIGGTLHNNHPDVGVEVIVWEWGDPNKGESTLTGVIKGVYTDGMRKIEIYLIGFIDGENEWPDPPLIRFVHVDTDFEDGGYLTLAEFRVLWLNGRLPRR